MNPLERNEVKDGDGCTGIIGRLLARSSKYILGVLLGDVAELAQALMLPRVHHRVEHVLEERDISSAATTTSMIDRP
jgi:hypothetical protein